MTDRAICSSSLSMSVQRMTVEDGPRPHELSSRLRARSATDHHAESSDFKACCALSLVACPMVSAPEPVLLASSQLSASSRSSNPRVIQLSDDNQFVFVTGKALDLIVRPTQPLLLPA